MIDVNINNHPSVGFGFCLPVLILFYPDTSSDVQLELVDHKSGFILLSEKTITSNAYFASVQRQEKRFERAFSKSTFTTLKKLNRQNKRNIREAKPNLQM